MIYFNNAATSYPKPPEVLEGIKQYLDEAPSDYKRSGAGFAGDSPDSCREEIARFIGADDSASIVFTSGATLGSNLVFQGILRPGDRVVTTMTEHNSVLRPLKHREAEGFIELETVPCDSRGYVDKDAYIRALGRGCALAVVNHGSNVTGVIQDIDFLGKLAWGAGALFCVDGSQTLGHLPIEVKRANIDFLIMTGHKGLFGLPGSGALYIGPNVSCQPVITGGTGTRSDLPLQPPEMPVRMEAGTRNGVGIRSMALGVKWLCKEGLDRVNRKTSRLNSLLREKLAERKEVCLYGPDDGTDTLPLLSFNLKGWDAAELAYVLESSFDIRVRGGLHCAPLIHKAMGTFPSGTVRISFSPFNTEEEVERLVEALDLIVRERL